MVEVMMTDRASRLAGAHVYPAHIARSESDERALALRARAGDPEAKTKLAEWARRTVGGYARVSPWSNMRGVSTDDLYQEAVVGMLKALATWNASRSPFRTYANVVIDNHINDWIGRQKGVLPTTRSARRRYRRDGAIDDITTAAERALRPAFTLSRPLPGADEVYDLHQPDARVADPGEVAEEREMSAHLLASLRKAERFSAWILFLRHGYLWGPDRITRELHWRVARIAAMVNEAEYRLREYLTAEATTACVSDSACASEAPMDTCNVCRLSFPAGMMTTLWDIDAAGERTAIPVCTGCRKRMGGAGMPEPYPGPPRHEPLRKAAP